MQKKISKKKKFTILRFYRIKWNIIENGGWHFSYLMEPKKIQEKLKSFAHSEYNSNFYTDIEKIKNAIENNKDLFNRNQKYEKIQLDNSFPDYILENEIKFQNWII